VVNQFARQKQITFAPDKDLEDCNHCIENFLPTIPGNVLWSKCIKKPKGITVRKESR
tara:strand:- start:2014 stop:2184 length:171 start_codon:yes stop_codon:yes gene_type:complete